MIYKDPFVNKESKDGRWFAWFPVQLEGDNKTAWLTHVKREYIAAGGYGMYIYRRLK